VAELGRDLQDVVLRATRRAEQRELAYRIRLFHEGKADRRAIKFAEINARLLSSTERIQRATVLLDEVAEGFRTLGRLGRS
jgi:hypothetical protein